MKQMFELSDKILKQPSQKYFNEKSQTYLKQMKKNSMSQEINRKSQKNKENRRYK